MSIEISAQTESPSRRAREISSDPAANAGSWVARYAQVRRWTERLCETLATEDYVVQSMPDVSPTKWHLAHTSWFFETFLLKPHLPGYQPFDPQFAYLFNSYYVTVGDRHCRQNRGLLSRPTVRDVYAYRKHVDEYMFRLLEGTDDSAFGSVVDLGFHHEQQHQELMLTDIKHVFWVNPLRPAFRERVAGQPGELPPMRWIAFPEGVRWVGYDGNGFSFDNESPRHRTFVEPFRLGSRVVTNGEFKAFIDDGGYRRADLWLSMGWATAQAESWSAPLYWLEQDGQWQHHTLAGLRPVEDNEPVCHVSYFEADAYARWAGARLPTEFEWESSASDVPMQGNFAESERFHPDALVVQAFQPVLEGQARMSATQEQAGMPGPQISQMFGDVWEWTRSPYSPYPGYQPAAGALGEYNGKFMCNQFVLRGGSCATPISHIRPTYRNFFPPDARWQFTGIRLAKDA